MLNEYDDGGDNKMQTLDRAQKEKEREKVDERDVGMPAFDNLIYTPWTVSLTARRRAELIV